MKLVKETKDGCKTIKFTADEFFHLSCLIALSDYANCSEPAKKYYDQFVKDSQEIAKKTQYTGLL
jgi:hypothetical protein